MHTVYVYASGHLRYEGRLVIHVLAWSEISDLRKTFDNSTNRTFMGCEKATNISDNMSI